MGFSQSVHLQFTQHKVHISNPATVNNQWSKFGKIIISHSIITKETTFIMGPIINEEQYYLLQIHESCLNERNPFLNCLRLASLIVTPFAKDIEIQKSCVKLSLTHIFSSVHLSLNTKECKAVFNIGLMSF